MKIRVEFDVPEEEYAGDAIPATTPEQIRARFAKELQVLLYDFGDWGDDPNWKAAIAGGFKLLD